MRVWTSKDSVLDYDVGKMLIIHFVMFFMLLQEDWPA